ALVTFERRERAGFERRRHGWEETARAIRHVFTRAQRRCSWERSVLTGELPSVTTSAAGLRHSFAIVRAAKRYPGRGRVDLSPTAEPAEMSVRDGRDRPVVSQ